MNEAFEEDEKLFRAIRPEGMYVKSDGSISSAAFSTTRGGCSVDRGYGRSELVAARYMKKSGRSGDIYAVSVSNCKVKDIFLKYAPTEENPYHSELYKNSDFTPMTKGQCRYLARVAKLILSCG